MYRVSYAYIVFHPAAFQSCDQGPWGRGRCMQFLSDLLASCAQSLDCIQGNFCQCGCNVRRNWFVPQIWTSKFLVYKVWLINVQQFDMVIKILHKQNYCVIQKIKWWSAYQFLDPWKQELEITRIFAMVTCSCISSIKKIWWSKDYMNTGLFSGFMEIW